jgi:serine/threonine protein kinase
MMDSRRFVVKGLLGQGGFGSVYLADMVSAGGFRKEVALKVLTGEVTANHDAAVRLRDEARLLGLLRHRNIVAVDDLVPFDEGWGVVMEYVPGVDLGVFITHLARQHQTFPVRAAVEVAQGIARALEAAFIHKKPDGEPLRAVHRDIKPGNVRITPEGEVKVLDFGIARGEFEAREAVTGDARFGSLAYMSPERVMGDPDGAPGDIYALGIVLWETLIGRPRGRAKLRPADHAEQVQEMLGALDAPAELVRLVEEMVDFDALERPEATEVGTRLRALLTNLPGPDLESLARSTVPRIMAASSIGPVGAMQEFIPHTGAAREYSSTVDFSGPGLPSTYTAVPANDVITGASVAPTLSPEPPPPTPASARSSTPVGWLAGAGLVAVLAVGGGWWLTSGAPPDASPSVSPPTASAPAAPTQSEVAVQPVSPVVPTPGGASAPPPEAPPSAVVPAGADEPVAEPSPTESSPRPAVPTPKPAPATKPAAAPAPPPEAAPAEAPPADAPMLRGVKFSATGATSIRATCAGTTGTGTSSALVRNIPAGACSVQATVDGVARTGRVTVDAPGLYTCVVEGDVLQCR